MPDEKPNHGIPTVYRGITFRSRLEAKWAAMFNNLKWGWEYEPFDLKGYIPDFILNFHQPVLAEVKPAMTFAECEPHIPKISSSEWAGDVLIFGGALKLGPNSFMGPECCLYGQYEFPMGRIWGPGEMHHCRKCGEISLHHTDRAYTCIVNGCYDGDSFLEPVDFDEIHARWVAAGEIVRWAPQKMEAVHA